MALVALMVAGFARPYRAAVTTVTLAVPGRTNANVSVSADGPFVVATWSASLPGGSTDIYAAVSRDTGATFSAPVRVNSTPGDARVNGEQPPRVVLIPGAGSPPAVVVVWTSKSAVGTTILSARSNDGVRTFGTSTIVPNGEAPGMRGWESVTVDARGAVRVLWLDHREMAKPAEGGRLPMNHSQAGHDSSADEKRDGAAMAQQSKLYIATVGDPASARSLLGGVCFCCKTAIVTAPNQAIYTAWRHVYPGNVRDMAFTVSRDGGRTFAAPTRISEDNWRIDGCPEDGPAIAADARNQIHVAWPTLVGDGPGGASSIGLFYARSLDGRTFSSRLRIPTEGLPHHPQIQVVGGDLVFAWDELKDGARRAVIARRPLEGGAQANFVRQVVSNDGPGVYPALAVSGQRAIVAWSSTGPQSAIRLAALQ